MLSSAMLKNISLDPNICNGQPVIAGTRITVQTVLEFLGAGDSIKEVLQEYPTLAREDVLAYLRFSSDLLKHQVTLCGVAYKEYGLM